MVTCAQRRWNVHKCVLKVLKMYSNWLNCFISVMKPAVTIMFYILFDMQSNTTFIALVHLYIMMTSSNGNIFRVTGPLCGVFAGHRWFAPHNGQWRGALILSLICAWINSWVNNRESGDLSLSHYNVTVMVLVIILSLLVRHVFIHLNIDRVYKSPGVKQTISNECATTMIFTKYRSHCSY